MTEGTTKLLSTKELLGKLRGKNAWVLPVAQRSFEWDEDRVTNLIDSMLRGFPVGTLLLAARRYAPYYEKWIGSSDSKRGSNAHHRKAVTDEALHEHLIDGQQRCTAIEATFGGVGLPDAERSINHLWVRVEQVNEKYRELHPKHGKKYAFRWEAKRQVGSPPSKKDRGWLPLSKLCDLKGAREVADEAGLDWKELGEPKKHAIKDLFQAVKDAYRLPRIPIHRLPETIGENTVAELHQAFIRINTGGIALSGVDVFFAGVKAYWPDAEECVATLRKTSLKTPLLSRKDTITLLARCAGQSLEAPHKPFDPLPLRLKHLSQGRDGHSEAFRAKMTAISEEGKLAEAIDWVTMLACNKLHLGARHVGARYLMAVVAWAYQTQLKGKELPRADGDDPQLTVILKFLFWSTVLGSYTYGRDSLDRSVFKRAWESGKKGESFPDFDKDSDFKKGLFGYQRGQNKLGRSEVDGFKHKEAKNAEKLPGPYHHLVRNYKGLFLGMFQRIDPDLVVELDHIFAFDLATKLFRLKSGRKRDKEYASWINLAGNLAGISTRANRALGKAEIPERLEKYKQRKEVGTDPNLNKQEERWLQEVHAKYEKRDCKGAGEVFRKFVNARTQRIWGSVVKLVGKPPRVEPKENPRNS